MYDRDYYAGVERQPHEGGEKDVTVGEHTNLLFIQEISHETPRPLGA